MKKKQMGSRNRSMTILLVMIALLSIGYAGYINFINPNTAIFRKGERTIEFCPNCKGKVSRDDRFCPECGSPLK